MSFTVEDLISFAREQKAYDIHLTVGAPTVFRINGKLERLEDIEDEVVNRTILSMLSAEQEKRLHAGEDIDFSFETSDGSRQRVNVFRQSGKIAASIRLLNSKVPSFGELGLPTKLLTDLCTLQKGLILVTGATGSGKSTTMAAMVNHINKTRPVHILTIEDPIEYKYAPSMATIHQREVGEDVSTFDGALRSALREDPDVILIGEMRDYETISLAITAAETGHLVIASLHTTNAPQTIDRIID
ncbi:MAG: Flp pilus assembly complex ATPase component TadA, partial [Oscillospiraceae bacterium]|nr:Flp pilus assembly complex ATPase component TadA [Oscillospiraceae bacterium]